jgi:hypothetical protein
MLNGLNTIKNDVRDIRKEAALLDFNQLREEAKAAFEKKAEIGYRVEATVENFNACWAKAVTLLQDIKEKSKQKNICLNFLLEELEIIKSAIKDESSYNTF